MEMTYLIYKTLLRLRTNLKVFKMKKLKKKTQTDNLYGRKSDPCKFPTVNFSKMGIKKARGQGRFSCPVDTLMIITQS